VQSLILSILLCSMSSWSAGSAATGPSAITPSRSGFLQVDRYSIMTLLEVYRHRKHLT
jgi:hypothetical protein